MGEDLHRAVLGERGGGVGGAVAEGDGDRLADAAGQGQQLQGRLADGTVHVVDVDEDFSHGTSSLLLAKLRGGQLGADQMNFWPARNSASCLPPSPSSLTIVPAVRAGRSVAESTLV
ncbi:hypothetical protein SGLAM104S_03236 [Streptomyces glaucescens]